MESDFPIKPILGYPAAYGRGILTLADLHVGIERELWQAGIRLSGIGKRIRIAIEEILDKVNPKKIIIVGDMKHNIPTFTRREAAEVRSIYETLSSQGDVLIVKGNHDGDLEAILPHATIVSGAGIEEEGILFFHGHAWPDPRITSVKYAMMGHIHPAITLEHGFWRYTEKCWVLFKANADKIEERYGSPNDPQICILPAFSPIIVGSNVLDPDQWIGPIGEHKIYGSFDVFLMDGTFVGTSQPSRGKD